MADDFCIIAGEVSHFCEPEKSNPGSVADFFLKEKSSF
jgi:hypothetical protein